MNINLSLSAALGFLLCIGHNYALADQGVPPGLPFVSPNGLCSVELIEIDREWRYAIRNVKSGYVDNSIVMPTVLLYLHWAANSQSIVTVEHIAKGSSGRVIYLKGGKWMDVKVNPPGDGWRDFAIVNLEIGADHVHYKFVVRHIKNDGIPLDHKFCDLDVDLRTGRRSNVRWISISEQEEAATLARKPSYIPPMKEAVNETSH